MDGGVGGRWNERVEGCKEAHERTREARLGAGPSGMKTGEKLERRDNVT